MPRISAFYGIVIYMYRDDHPRPHFHAWYSGAKAKIDARTGEVFEGDIPPRVRRLVRRWTKLHGAELLRNWELAEKGQTLIPIDPLP